jgi:hypothetical protein
MQNSLGLDVHGEAETQGRGQSPDFVLSTSSSPKSDHPEDTELRWGVLAEAGTNQQDDMWTRGTEDSWGIPAETSTTEQGDIWNKGAEDNWGTVEEANPTQNDVASKKDKEAGLEEEVGTTQKDDKSKKDKGTPYVPAKPPVRVGTPASTTSTFC